MVVLSFTGGHITHHLETFAAVWHPHRVQEDLYPYPAGVFTVAATAAFMVVYIVEEFGGFRHALCRQALARSMASLAMDSPRFVISMGFGLQSSRASHGCASHGRLVAASSSTRCAVHAVLAWALGCFRSSLRTLCAQSMTLVMDGTMALLAMGSGGTTCAVYDYICHGRRLLLRSLYYHLLRLRAILGSLCFGN